MFGTNEWFRAIDHGLIKKYIVKGVISRLYLYGHNDYPVFEIENSDGKTKWTQVGTTSEYIQGRGIELEYVEQRYKRPSDITGVFSKCILCIRVISG